MIKVDKDNFEEEIVQQILDDFKERQLNKKSYELAWQLNINYLIGNQYCSINGNGEIVDNPKQFFWQEREVFNHIAPMIDLRISKLNKIRPSLTVLPFSDNDRDIACAKISKNLLKSVSYDINMSEILSAGTMWSEVCGTVFYKVSWDSNSGRVIGVDENGVSVKEGEVKVDVISPFEIYPDSNTYSRVADCKSIIHARAYHIDTIKNLWGVDVEGSDIDVFTLDNINNLGGLGYNATTVSVARKVKKNHALVIEKYESPTIENPNGKVTLIAGNKLIYVGELPYINSVQDERGFPFVMQKCVSTPNCFWGTSIIERCIPVQRAYNAIKNRKHEFLNRLSMGVLTVEDGSLDVDDLEEEGLSPGKILIYRQGSNIPRLLSSGNVPTDFTLEEDRLLAEFMTITGVSDLLNGNTLASANISGVALQLLIEQDESRMISSAEEIRNCAKEISKQILRLYKQFAILPHYTRLIGDNGSVEMFSWRNSDISSEDVVFETENEISQTIAQKRSMIYEILQSGLLHDENGVLSNATRQKVLQQLGIGMWETTQDIKTLQVGRATKENFNLIQKGYIESPLEIDDHELHITNHTAFVLGSEFEGERARNPQLLDMMLNHIREHKKFEKVTNQINLLNQIGDNDGRIN